MTRAELEHAIRAACDIAEDTEVYVFGSQAILGEYPDAPPELRQSAEADIAPKNFPERFEKVDAEIGELSRFHDTHGFYVHGISIESAVLPRGWKGRVKKVQNENTFDYIGWCIEDHDLAASKLVAFRDKDGDFVRVLMAEHMVAVNKLVARINILPATDEAKERLRRWVMATARDLFE